jgi:hypothetical protein
VGTGRAWTDTVAVPVHVGYNVVVRGAVIGEVPVYVCVVVEYMHDVLEHDVDDGLLEEELQLTDDRELD